MKDVTTGLCCECGVNRCEDECDEICKECWDAFIAKSNAERIRKIEAGWTVDETGTIHPPNK